MLTKVPYEMLLDPRIPIIGSLTLNVAANGDDATGDHTGNPFATPQAAMDYASSKLDFRDGGTGNLTLSIGAGQYGELKIRALPPNISAIFVKGPSGETPTLSNIVSHAPCEVVLSNISFNGGNAGVDKQVLAYHNATIILSGDILFYPNATVQLTPVAALNGGHISLDGATIYVRNGSYYNCILFADSGGFICMGGSSIQFDDALFANAAFAFAINGGKIMTLNITCTGQISCRQYQAVGCGQIISGGQYQNYPGDQPGLVDASSVVC